jgi:tetratricopeptide (TPR) repeat protein
VGQLRLLVGLYIAPLKTFSRILDEGRLLVAVIAAVVVGLVFQLPTAILMYEVARVDPAAIVERRIEERQAAQAAKVKNQGQNKNRNDGDESDPEPAPAHRGHRAPLSYTPPLSSSIDDFTLNGPILYFPWATLLAVAVCFLPAAIMVITITEGWRSFCSILYRDYLALLVCFLMAWSVAYMPLALLRGAQLASIFFSKSLHRMGATGYVNTGFGWAAHLYFLVLCVCAIRVVAGVDFRIAASAVAGGWVGAIGGLWLGDVFGFGGYWILSPCLFYALWSRAQKEALWVGSGLRSRQALKRQLEISTLNPRDADAHCQLGLIYLERRQNELASQRFRAAIEIDPDEPDARYHLGCILRRQGRPEEALEYLHACARVDEKHALNEVWREIGTAAFLAGRTEEALEALERFIERRSYDPEGRCWYGRVLVKLDRRAAAERAFQDAIEAVRTMPPARRRQVREWEGQASRDLRILRASRSGAAADFATVR